MSASRVSARPLRAAAGAFVLAALAAHPAAAQGNDTVTAEALFQQGKALLGQNRFAEACPKLAESQRVDPATGTLMALALCHEGNGQLASAWAEFTDVEGLSRKDGREDRQKLAHERAVALRPRLSTLELDVPPEVATLEGIVVKRDGQELGRGVWNTAVPIDGGPHDLEAAANGKVTWRTRVSVKVENDHASIKVPPLKAAPAAEKAAPLATEPAPPDAAAEPANRAAPAPESRGLSTTQWVGIGVASAGVVALGVGGYFLATALGENSDSKKSGDPSYCDDTGCGDKGRALRHDAVVHGNIATALGVTGGVLLAGGATLFFVGRSSASSSAAALENLRLGANANPYGAALHLAGSF